MKKVSQLFTERPQKPLETALWWTEYVLRHDQDHLSALRPMSALQPWWKRRQLDVWAAIAGSTMVILGATIYLLAKIVTLCSGTSSVVDPTKGQLRKKLQ